MVGVNKYRAADEKEPEVRHIDNESVRAAQLRRLEQVRANRDQGAVDNALQALRDAAAKRNDGNLLALAVDAARARATLGEISAALEDEWGRYQAVPRLAPGVYGASYQDANGELDAVRDAVTRFENEHGRRPRLLVAKAGQDGHTRGANVIATAFSDLGFDVDLGPLFSTPTEVVNAAIENDVDIVGLSSLGNENFSACFVLSIGWKN